MSGVCNLQRGYTGNIQPYRADAHRTGEEAIIAALQSEGVPEKTAREMLGQGYGVKQVASRTGLPVATVTGLADTAGKTGAPSGGGTTRPATRRHPSRHRRQHAAARPGHQPARRIENGQAVPVHPGHLMWEPGSAEAVLKGGLPTHPGPTPTPHPALVPLSAVLDRQRQLLAQLNRWEQRIAQMKTEVTESINHINVALNDIEEFRRREGAGTETPSTNGLVGADHDDTAEQDRGSDT